MTISIIIPSYNTDISYLKRCLNSLINQSYREYEVLIIDDGSKRPLKDSIPKNIFKDHRFKIIRQNNLGASAARNTGLLYAKGEYISFVDADDCMAKNWLEYSVRILEDKDADAVYGRVVMCDRGSLENNFDYEIKDISYEGKEIINIQRLLLDNNKSPLPNLDYIDLGQCGKLFKRDIIQNIKFPENLSLSEDQVFLHRTLRVSSKIVISNKIAYYYISNHKSTSHSYHPSGISNMKRAMFMIKELLIDKEKLIESYSYRTVFNIMLGINLQYFNKRSNTLSFIKKYRRIKYELNDSLYRESLERINVSQVYIFKDKIKLYLIKKFDWLYFALQEIKTRL